ncbi:MAG: hypothetical protein HYX96_01080 [Chloroflexi bacterium]|nr:hypothetical protein [Chloroflexota bacterium]
MAMIIGLALAIPLVLLPVAFIWYLNLGGVYAALKERRVKKAPGGAPVEYR